MLQKEKGTQGAVKQYVNVCATVYASLYSSKSATYLYKKEKGHVSVAWLRQIFYLKIGELHALEVFFS